MGTIAYIRPNALAEIDQQRLAILSRAALLGVSPSSIEILIEERIGPVWKSLVADVRSGQVTIVFVWTLSAFGRTAFSTLRLMGSLLDAGARVVSVEDGIDLGQRTNAARVVAALLRLERLEARGRTRAGLRAAQARGVQVGRPPSTTITPEQARAKHDATGSIRRTAADLGVSRSVVERVLRVATIEGVDPDETLIEQGLPYRRAVRRYRRTDNQTNTQTGTRPVKESK